MFSDVSQVLSIALGVVALSTLAGYGLLRGNVQNLRQNVAWVDNGPLPDDMVEAARAAFRAHDRDWVGQI